MRTSLAPLSVLSLATVAALGCQPQSSPANTGPAAEGAGAEQQAEGERADSGDTAEPGEPEVLGELDPIAPAGPHAFSVLDMLEVDRVSSPALAPDGKTLAYVLRETAYPRSDRASHVRAGR